MQYNPMFLRQITEAFLVRTEPASSMVKPAAIHITRAPQMRNANVLRTYSISPSIAAFACAGSRPRARMIVRPATVSMRFLERPRIVPRQVVVFITFVTPSRIQSTQLRNPAELCGCHGDEVPGGAPQTCTGMPYRSDVGIHSCDHHDYAKRRSISGLQRDGERSIRRRSRPPRNAITVRSRPSRTIPVGGTQYRMNSSKLPSGSRT